MKVAFVHDWLNGMRGGEKVLEVLLDLWPQADVFTLFYEPDQVSETIRRRRIVVSPLQRLPGTRRGYRNLLPLFPWAVGRFDLREYDLVVSVSHCVAKAARASSPSRHFCYCLSPMRYLWSHYDQYFRSRDSGWLNRTAMAALQGPLRRWDRRACDRVGRFAAISRTVADRIARAYSRDAEVIYPPVDTDFFTPADAAPADYFLAVSAFVPYKRLDLAIAACNDLRLPLKVVGKGPLEARLRSLAGPTIEFLGWVSDERLRDLYRRCRALIFPAEEDFGLAPLEAQACGRPVLAYRGGGALETVAEGATGAFFGEQSNECLSEALRAFQPGAYAVSALRENALRFRRERFEREFRAAVGRSLTGS
ncbi:MAG: glycosyltransferase [Candidatus Sumerlaeota bacterium]|nr:glycosyltransferase [Candidatus Sumerlaeota bacterium]